MTALKPAKSRISDLGSLFTRLEAENVMDIDAIKETAYAQQAGARFAILDEEGTVIGYVSGKYSGAPTLPADNDMGEVTAFVAMIVIDQVARKAGHAQHALREFANRARHESGARRAARSPSA